MNLRIERYRPELATLWDEAVRASRNGIFQHLRAYMDYHSDRFADFSLMALDERDRVVALLPAHVSGTTIASHRGLSFGGWLLSRRVDAVAFNDLWTEFLELCRAGGFDTLVYRPSPHIYHRYPCEEDLYALWRSGAVLSARLAGSVAPVADGTAVFDMACRQSVRRAAAAGVTVQVSDDYRAFWQLLEERLRERYDASPVHTLAEIELLHSRFPDNIRLYTATHGDTLLGGIVMYVTDTVGHSQYTATSAAGRDMRVVPLIYSKILGDLAAAGVQWMDYGTSNEDGGRVLNEGLVRQKAGFGARLLASDTYTLPL